MKNVKSLKRYDCTDKGQNQLLYEVEYNEQEKPVLEIEYSQGGIPISTNTYEYDEEGYLIAETLQGDEKEAYQRFDYSYGEDKKNRIKTLTYSDGSTEKEETLIEGQQKIQKKYDLDQELVEQTTEVFREDGQIESLEYYNANMESTEKHLYGYNEKSQLVEEKILVDDEENSTTIWEYNENGKVVLEESYDPDENLIHKHFYKYEGDQLVEEGIEEYSSYNNQVRFHYEYDEKGQLIRQVQESYSGELIQEVAYELNERGDIVMVHFIRTGLYQMLYGSSTADYNQSIRNDIEYYD